MERSAADDGDHVCLERKVVISWFLTEVNHRDNTSIWLYERELCLEGRESSLEP
jgi:hypothetical protein